jgi:hypothetical protein
MNQSPEPMETDTPIFFFDHPYPRYGLAAALVQSEAGREWKDLLDQPDALWTAAREAIREGLQRFRVHTNGDLDSDRELQYRWLSNDELESGGQKADDGYYIAPHVVISDGQAHNLIPKVRSMLEELQQKEVDPQSSVEMKRSFAPFTAKLNQGTKSLSYLKSTRLEAIFSLVATLTPLKPAAQVDFTNQVMVPDLDLPSMMRFVALFNRMTKSEMRGGLTRKRREGSQRKRPPLFDGNYPDAPPGNSFGPIGLMAAIGEWGSRAGETRWAGEVLEALAGKPIYLVSYDGDLMRQEQVGHHAERLAKKFDLASIVKDLYDVDFYKPEDNQLDSKNRQEFYRMASRFLRLYTPSAFQDFLAYRVQYHASFSQILSDYFMKQQEIDSGIVQSARAYGAYLNSVAYHIAREEVEENEEQEGEGTGRSLYEAKTRALAQLESTAMSARRPSALFAQLNVDAGRQSNRDVPAEAERFFEATNTGEISPDVARDLVLAYMRLRSGDASAENTESNNNTAEDPE